MTRTALLVITLENRGIVIADVAVADVVVGSTIVVATVVAVPVSAVSLERTRYLLGSRVALTRTHRAVVWPAHLMQPDHRRRRVDSLTLGTPPPKFTNSMLHSRTPMIPMNLIWGFPSAFDAVILSAPLIPSLRKDGILELRR